MDIAQASAAADLGTILDVSDPGARCTDAVGPHRTPSLALGPFYPLGPPAGVHGDLWQGGSLPAGARGLVLDGRVVDLDGRPVVAADVELWHADPGGRYRHPSAPGAERVLPGFAGYGRVRTDAHGRFRFRTVVPGAYADGLAQRVPHLHLQITGRFDRLVTQLFLPQCAANTQDPLYRTLRQPRLVTAEAALDDAANLSLRWTAVLTLG